MHVSTVNDDYWVTNYEEAAWNTDLDVLTTMVAEKTILLCVIDARKNIMNYFIIIKSTILD